MKQLIRVLMGIAVVTNLIAWFLTVFLTGSPNGWFFLTLATLSGICLVIYLRKEKQ